jgi:hypothetical protein
VRAYLEYYADWHIPYTYPQHTLNIPSGEGMHTLKIGSLIAVPVPDPVPVSNTEKTETIDSTFRGRRFSDHAQHLIDLWNEKAPRPLPRVKVLSPGLDKKIRAAYKCYPERKDWEEIIGEYELSEFLRRKDEGHGWKDLMWLLSDGKVDKIENYVKVKNGRYHDEKPSGFSEKTKGNEVLTVQLYPTYGRGGFPPAQPGVQPASSQSSESSRATPLTPDTFSFSLDMLRGDSGQPSSRHPGSSSFLVTMKRLRICP